MKKTMFFKVIVLMISIAVVFTACKKDDPANNPKDVEVEFLIQQTDFENLKSTGEDVPECQDLPWSYVKFTIDGVDYTSNIITVGNDILTQAVKLPSGVTYKLTKFLVYSDVLPIGEDPNDKLVRAAPAKNSTYWDLMENPLDVDVEVFEFSKRQVVVDVLCYEDLYYEAFGFNWFEQNDVKIEYQCFFGDICVDDLSIYEGSLYADQSQGLQMDMPAIMKIEVYKSVDQDPPVWGDPIRTFTNDEWQTPGEGECMEVYWANDLDLTEDFKFELYVWLPNTDGVFEWTLIDTPWEFLDENCPEPGIDGVVDYVVGDCQIDDPDFHFPMPVTFTAVGADDLATDFTDPGLAYKWFFYNDETDQINNALGSFVGGPAPTPAGTGSAQISVSGTERVCLATYQFAGTPLDEITTFSFSTYNPSAGNGYGVNASGYLNFNIDFDGSDAWQKRLVYVPKDNGTVTQDTWQEWDVINDGNSIWRWSGNLNGGNWPDGDPSATKTWSDILSTWPNARIRVSDPFVGVRVGEPYQNGYTENLDAFKFGTTSIEVFDFEN